MLCKNQNLLKATEHGELDQTTLIHSREKALLKLVGVDLFQREDDLLREMGYDFKTFKQWRPRQIWDDLPEAGG